MSMQKSFKIITLLFLGFSPVITLSQVISNSFEVRHFSSSPKSNGESDFKGKTSVFNNDQRVDFLKAYATYGKIFWKDARLDKEVYPIVNAKQQANKIKPQPSPQVRKRLLTDEWDWIGYKNGIEQKDKIELDKWKFGKLTKVQNGQLLFFKSGQLSRKIPPQSWRCQFEAEINLFDAKAFKVSLNNCAAFGKDASGRQYYSVDEKKVYYTPTKQKNGLVKVKIDLDFTTHRYNFYLEEELIGNYVSFSNGGQTVFSNININAPIGLKMDNIHVTGYKRLTADAHYPFEVTTILDEDFTPVRQLGDWLGESYNDAQWQKAELPIVHGGERYKGEDLYLRKKFAITDIKTFNAANLYIESLTPSGILFVNGKMVEVIHNPGPVTIDIRKYLKTGINTIAVKVDAYEVSAGQIMTHTSTDKHTGWFSGRIHLDLLKSAYIKDVFTYTNSIDGKKAEQTIKVSYQNLTESRFKGKLRISIAPWFPNEGASIASEEILLNAMPIEQVHVSKLIINNPALWSADQPQLYSLKTELLDSAGKVIDDHTITTGIRTISQTGGTFQINNKPELLKAPLLFGNRAPLEKVAQWDKCPPVEYLVQEMMMIKQMNGNGIRMSVHDSKTGGVNDPRIAELADQLGLMLIWQTSAWIREGNVFNINFKQFQADAKLVRNHPSIVIWQSANHPFSWFGWEGITTTYEKIYKEIIVIDSSRLISPSADMRIMYNIPNDEGTRDNSGNNLKPDPAWTAPLITRGSMDYMGGYGAEWTTLRKWPFLEKDERPLYYETNEFQTSFLNSKERAYFNFEHDESIGQPNWDLAKGKPWYFVPSYEWDYDIGSIGRRLEFSEWETSQAWQALITYETVKKCRLMDYDGISWCNLRGGANTATYQKSLIDYLGFAKLAYYANQMEFQNTVAGSNDVDVDYGPDDKITPAILHVGEERNVNLEVRLLTSSGELIETRLIKDIKLESGRSTARLKAFSFKAPEDGYYVVNYVVHTNTK
jgi:hypothetical protein